MLFRSDAYTAKYNGNDGGGAIMDLSFNGAEAPTNLRWIQFINTTAPFTPGLNPSVDGQHDNLPFFWKENATKYGVTWGDYPEQTPTLKNPGKRIIQNPNANTDLVFLDAPFRRFSRVPIGDFLDWKAELYLVTWDEKFAGTVTIHDGIKWGFKIKKDVPEPLTTLGAVVVLGAIPVLKKKYAKSNKNKDGDT